MPGTDYVSAINVHTWYGTWGRQREESCSSHKCVNKSLHGLKTKKFPNLANFIQAMKSLTTDLTNVNGHRHIGVKPGTQVSNIVERLVESPTVMESIAIFDN